MALIIVMSVGAGVWTDFLWFRSVGYTSVFDTTYGVKWALFAITAAFMIVVIGASMRIAHGLRPRGRPLSSQQAGLEAFRLVIDPHRRLVAGVVLGLIGLIAGLAAAGSWRTWLLFANRTSFGTTDPQFHLDISFFVFDYPFIRMVLSLLFAAILLSLVAAALVHYLYGGLRLQRRGERATQGAQAHLFVLAGIFVLLKAVAYFVDRYGIDFSQRGVVRTGASYTDVNAVLPAKTVLAVIAVICAALFFAGALRRNALLPAVGFGLLVLSAVIIGGVYPAIVQQFVVKPNELAKEGPYLTREIAATRSAYGISQARVTPYPAVSTESAASLASQAAALPDVRQLDPGVMSAAFQQLQQVKGYYKFPGVLSVDRYVLPGSSVPQDVIVGTRGMSGPPAGQDNWINSHLVYTHGFGLVAASADAATSAGNPSFTESDIPPSGQLDVRQPRVYFGEQERSYAIVGGRQPELDYPNQSASGQANTTYHGARPQVVTPGRNRQVTVYGAIEMTTGEWAYRLGRRCAADFIALLRMLDAAFPRAPKIVVICDNDSIHHARAVTRHLETHPRLEVLYGARYSPHDNPVERVWARLKNYVASTAVSWSGRLRQIHAYFRSRSPDQMLATAAPWTSPWLPPGYEQNFWNAA